MDYRACGLLVVDIMRRLRWSIALMLHSVNYLVLLAHATLWYFSHCTHLTNIYSLLSVPEICCLRKFYDGIPELSVWFDVSLTVVLTGSVFSSMADTN